ncbi:MAG: hypothetical protein IJA34_07695 [Lachnospiraceae bacterium]|nr:hypothetical protein [Lachnospiraceae bacterium]
MKAKDILNALNDIDEDMINDVKKSVSNGKSKFKLKLAIVCICVVAIISVIFILKPDNTNVNKQNNGDILINNPTNNSGKLVVFNDITRNYKDVNISAEEINIEWKWEDKTTFEKYGSVKFNGREYVAKGQLIEVNKLSDVIGNCKAEGYDIYTDKNYVETFEVRRVKGISENKVIAVGLENEYYIYSLNSSNRPNTFGEIIDNYNLGEVLKFDKFMIYEGYDEKGYYKLDDDDFIIETLLECRGAKVYENCDEWNHGDINYLSFTISSQELGVYKRVLYITEDGYLATNIFDYNYVYFIGKEMAVKIISYAKNNSVETETEPYEYTFAGTLTEISDEYILIDDSKICVNENEGMIFKVLTNDLRVSRCLKYGNLAVGDIVVVKFGGKIDTVNDNVIKDVKGISKGQIQDGGIAVTE